MPVALHTSEYRELLQYGIGLTDSAKQVSGVDANIKTEDYDAAAFVQKMLFFQPRIICFNGKKAAAEYTGEKVRLDRL